MNLVLDFSDARETSCHCYTGVQARVGEGDWTPVTITPEGCRHGFDHGPSAACTDPTVDAVQAWSMVVMLTGKEGSSPIGDGLWDARTRRMEFALRSSGRRPITECINTLPTS